MKQIDEQTNHNQQKYDISASTPEAKQPPATHHTQHSLTPKQFLSGADIRSRFDQISGQRLPKRMTTGKFVHLGPTDHPPEGPL